MIQISFGELHKKILDRIWDYDKNDINPFQLSSKSGKKIWIKCLEKDYHGSYEISCDRFSSGSRCPYCVNRKIHPLDSFGEKYKEVLGEIWDYEKNDIDPYRLAPSTRQKVWIKYLEKDYHGSYSISCANYTYGFRCVAMLLAAAKVLNDNKDKLKGSVKLLFQSGEEIITGAKLLI